MAILIMTGLDSELKVQWNLNIQVITPMSFVRTLVLCEDQKIFCYNDDAF